MNHHVHVLKKIILITFNLKQNIFLCVLRSNIFTQISLCLTCEQNRTESRVETMVDNFDENEEYNSDAEAKKSVKKKKKKKPRKSSGKKESKKKKKKRRNNDLTSHRYFGMPGAIDGSAQTMVFLCISYNHCLLTSCRSHYFRI